MAFMFVIGFFMTIGIFAAYVGYKEQEPLFKMLDDVYYRKKDKKE